MKPFHDISTFYQTTPKLAKIIAQTVKTHFDYKKLDRDFYGLDACSGECALADAVTKIYQYDNWSYKPKQIDCIEIDIRLQAVARGKNYSVVGNDFLNYNGKTAYDFIVMNPPFDNADKCILKAFEVLYQGGLIVALCNSETIKNPFSRNRQKLAKLIEENNGAIEYYQDEFLSDDADRKTNVEVALIVLEKQFSEETKLFNLNLLKKDREIYATAESHSETLPMVKQNDVKELVYLYNTAIDSMIKSKTAWAESQYHKRLLNMKTNENCYIATVNLKKEINKEIKEIRASAWSQIITLTKFSKLMTRAVAEKFESLQRNFATLEFTEDNINDFLLMLWGNKSEIENQALLEVFDLFTQYHADNIIHYEGWKSNNPFKVGDMTAEGKFIKRRVVFPYGVSNNYVFDKTKVKICDPRKLHDIDRVLSKLDGLPETTSWTINSISDRQDLITAGEKYESKYFEIRAFKKGTMHLYFKDPKILRRLNIAAGKLRNWLPFNATEESLPENLLMLSCANDKEIKQLELL